MGEQQRPGRPRDRQISERALEATRELLVEQGFGATTVRAVSERAGVHLSALYRRWPSRIELIEEATFPGFDPSRVRPTGDLRRDLRSFLRLYTATFRSRALLAAAPGLLAHYQQTPSRETPEHYLRVSTRPLFAQILSAAPRGMVAADVDLDAVFDMVLGTILVRTLIKPVIAKHTSTERTVEVILRMVRPIDR